MYGKGVLNTTNVCHRVAGLFAFFGGGVGIFTGGGVSINAHGCKVEPS